MGIANLLRLKLGTLTNQQIADMALQSDRAARRARDRNGDEAAAIEHERERDALCDQMEVFQ